MNDDDLIPAPRTWSQDHLEELASASGDCAALLEELYRDHYSILCSGLDAELVDVIGQAVRRRDRAMAAFTDGATIHLAHGGSVKVLTGGGHGR